MAQRLHKEKGIGIRTQRIQTRTFVWQIIHGVLRLIVIVGLLALVWYVTRLPMFTITEVTVSGGETIPHDEVRASVLQELQGTYFLIIPKRFSFLYPHERIYEVVAKNASLYDIHVVRASRTELKVSFKEYVPYALWCTQSINTVPCLFMTEDGYAFSEAPLLQGGVFVRYAEEGIDKINIGYVRTKEQLNAIEYFIQRMEHELGLRVASVLFTHDGDIELSIHGGGKIFVSGKDSLEIVFDNVQVVMKSQEFKHLKPGNFQYIDVRFNNKVFVNETMSDIASSTATSSEKLPE